MIRGSCLCSASAFEIEGRLSPMQTCHCSRCRKTSGTAFSTGLLTASKSFRWLRGRELICVFDLPSGFRHAFCKVCGSPMPGPDVGGKVVSLPAGCLDDDPGTRPFRHTYVGSKAAWYEITDDLDRFDEWAAGEVRGDPREIVRSGYDKSGPTFSAQRERDPGPELARLIELLPERARVLDLGCGAGVPVTAALASCAEVVGVDISAVQIEQARKQVPEAAFIVADIAEQAFEASTFDAVVCFYALFHLPREEHRPLLERIATWLRPGGYLLATFARRSHPGYTEPDFFGAPMYWSHFDGDWYTGVLRELGFGLLADGVIGHGYRDASARPEHHPIILARKPKE